MTKTKRSTKLPTSKAKNAYDLLTDIGTLALKEPRRMRMGQWLLRSTALMDLFGVPATERPRCGAVGCIGGWTEILRPGLSAGDTLGLTARQKGQLFCTADLVRDDDQGTLAHAKRVVAHIKRFQKKYATRLRAKAV